MNISCRQFFQRAGVAAAVAALAVILSSHGASSQTTRTIKVVVPFAPGGAEELLFLIRRLFLRESGSDNYLGINRGQLVLVGEPQRFTGLPCVRPVTDLSLIHI